MNTASSLIRLLSFSVAVSCFGVSMVVLPALHATEQDAIEQVASADSEPASASSDTSTDEAEATDHAASSQAPPKPENIFFLLERVTARIEGGLKGLPAGTKVRLLDSSRPKWTLTDMSETAFIEVDPAILTRDEATAKAMLIEDAAQRQAALAARALERQRAEEQERLRREAEAKSLEQNRIPERQGLTGETNLQRSTLK